MNHLLIIGLGNVARRTLPLLQHWDVQAVNSQTFNLDNPDFSALPAHVDAVLYTAPPPNHSATDPRIQRLLQHWQNQPKHQPKHMVYISTTGVYGDSHGQWIDEQTPVQPATDRAHRRVNAESQLIAFAQTHQMSLTILRAPGIYALDRLPLARLLAGTPMLTVEDDGYSNHIHADDLAAACVAAIDRPQGIEIYNVCDDLPTRMGDWFTALAQAAQLPAPHRLPMNEIQTQVPASLLSFMQESRQIRNRKIKSCLYFTLQYPTVYDFINTHQIHIVQAARALSHPQTP